MIFRCSFPPIRISKNRKARLVQKGGVLLAKHKGWIGVNRRDRLLKRTKALSKSDIKLVNKLLKDLLKALGGFKK